jgi:Na+-transporting methylmalonyl-CoA/oxaloacetate decarboxylase gamma subunit
MSFATRFLLLVIIGIAIAAIGMHLTELFVGMAFLFGLMITFYGLPLLAVLFLLVLAWKLVWGIGGAKPKSVSQSKPEQVKQTKPTSHIEIERELNRMKHQVGQMNKKGDRG